MTIAPEYGNTLLIVVIGTVLNLLVTSGAAYSLSRRSMAAGKPIMMGFVFTMMFSGGLIPLFLVVRDLGLYNSLWSLYLQCPYRKPCYQLFVVRKFTQIKIL